MRQPSFDTWTSIFLFAAVQGLFVSVVLFFMHRNQQKGRIYLALITFLFSITLIEYVGWWTGYLKFFPPLVNISATFPFLYGPLLYYYFKTVFTNDRFHYSDLLIWLPFVINMADMVDYYFTPAATKLLWMSGTVKADNFFHYWQWLQIAHMIIYAVVIFRKFYATSMAQQEVKTWFRYLMLFYILYVLSFTSYYVLVLFPWFNLQYDYMISFAMMFTIYFLAWFGYLQPGVFKGFSIGETMQQQLQQQKYRNSALTPDISDTIAERLQQLMNEDKLYRENDLGLEKLASLTGTAKHHLSQVINEKLGVSFFEYINTLRIKEAQELLSETKRSQLNISEVAFQVGFNNKVSFNSTFKKITGMTPSEFRKKKVISDEINNSLN